MIEKKYIIIFVLIVGIFINGFAFWSFFSPVKIVIKESEAAALANDFQVINEAKKNLDGRVFCAAVTKKEEPVEKKIIEGNKPVEKIYSLSILNGSGVPGAAKLFGDKLKEIGWVSIVSFGNTQKTEQTILKLKKDLPSENKKILIQNLNPDYSNIKEEIDNTIGDDIVIVLGSE